MPDKYEKLEKLKALLDRDAITYDEYEAEKARILAEAESAFGDTPSDYRPWGMEETAFCTLLHLSQLTSAIVPGAGFVLPIVMWATEKDRSHAIDLHGKAVLNWMISSLIYLIVSGILVLFLIGIPMLIALVIAELVFVIYAAMKANQGIVWKYPLSIPFFRVE